MGLEVRECDCKEGGTDFPHNTQKALPVLQFARQTL